MPASEATYKEVGLDKQRVKMLFSLFLSTFKIGAFTFGGGYAMIPIMKEEFVNRKGWVSETDILDIFAISQSVPGVIALNTSTFIGYRVGGVAGAAVAALGVTVPSFIIIALLTGVYIQFKENLIVNTIFKGVRASVVGLMFSAILTLGKAGVKNLFGLALALAGFVLVAFFSVHTALAVIGAGFAGYIAYVIRKQRGKRSGTGHD